MLFNTNYSIQQNSFICTQSNGSKYCYLVPIIQFRHSIKEFQVLLFNTYNSIKHYLFVCTQLNGSNYCYVSLAIQLNISHLITHSEMIKQFYFKQFDFAWVNKVNWFQVLLCFTYNSIKHRSFVYTQLNGQTVLFQTIQFSISHLHALSLNVKQFYLIHW